MMNNQSNEQVPNTSNEEAAVSSNIARLAIIILFLAAILAGAWYLYSTDTQQSPVVNNDESQVIEHDSNEVVAIVNGEELIREKYQQVLNQYEQMSAQQGAVMQTLESQEQMQTQAMDTLISQTLLLQAARQADITSENSEVETQLAQIQAQFEDEAAFANALSSQGLSIEKLRTEISNQLTMDAYLEQEIDFASIAISDAEVDEFYSQISASSEEVPPFEDIREQLKNNLLQQKQQEKVASMVKELRAESNVEILL